MLLVFIGLYIPPLSIVVFFSGIPFMMLTHKDSLNASLICGFISFLLTSFFVPVIISLFLLIVIHIPLSFMGIKIRGSKDLLSNITKGFILMSIGASLYIALLNNIFDFDFVDQIKTSIVTTIDLMKANSTQFKQIPGLMGIDALNNMDINMIVDSVIKIVPSILIFTFILVSTANYFVGGSIIKKLYKEEDVYEPDFKNIVVPGDPFFGFLTSYILYFVLISTKIVEQDILVSNIIIVFMMIFLLQGIGVTSYLLDKFKVSNLIKYIIIIVSVLMSNILIMISVLGFLDSFMNFRKIKRY
jgi:uncharacterized protein YybS (DUF2232 family)